MLFGARRAVLSILGLGPEEFARTWPLAGCYAATLAALYVQKPVRNALFLDVLGLERLPWVLLAVALLGAVAASAFARLSARRSISKSLPFVLAGGALAVAGFRAWLGDSGEEAVFAFYLGVNLFGQLATSLLWLWANESFDTRQARRVFGVIAGAGILGAFVGGVGTEYWVGRFGLLDSLWFAFAAWLAAFGFSLLEPRSARPVRVSDGRVRASLGALWASPLVRVLSLSAVAGAATSALVDLQFNAVVDRAFERADDKAAFFGAFFAWLNLAAFAFQLLVAPALLRRFGLGASILLLPVSLLGGALFTLLQPAVSSGVALKSADVGLRHSLGRSVTEVLFAPLPAPVRVRARVLLDSLFDSLGTGIGAALGLLLLSRAEPGLRDLGIATAATVLLSLWASSRMRPAYLDALRSSLLRREVEPEALDRTGLGAPVRELLVDSLRSPNDRQVDYALDVLRGASARGIAAELHPLLRHEQALIRSKALVFLAEQGDREGALAAQDLVDDPEPGVRAEALRVLLVHGSDRAGALAEYLESEDPSRWQAALRSVAAAPRREDVLLFEPGLIERLSKTEAAEALVQAVGRCLLEFGVPDRVPWLVARLKDGRTRRAASEALVALGPRAHAALARELREPNGLALGVAMTLSRGRDRASRRILSDELALRPPSQRGDLLLACVERRRREARAFPSALVTRLLASEIAWRAELGRVATALARESTRLLTRVVAERIDESRVRVLRTLSLAYPLAELHGAEFALRSSDARVRARAIELLDEMLRPEHRRVVMPVFEAGPRRSEPSLEPATAVRWLLEQPDEWLRTVARFEHASRAAVETGSVDGVLGVVERVLLLQSVDAFASATSEQLSLVAAIATERSLEPGETLYREGDPADAMYVVVSGSIRLERSGISIGVVGANEAFGTWSLFEQESRLTGATTGEASALLRIDRSDFLDVLADHVDLTRAILASIARRLRAVLERVGR
jgi:AAA family ATP:ADP antiporter